jgi:ribosome-binding protein aMBF1 (putative translation factor)
MVMREKGKKKDAVGILHRRYIGDDAERKASLQTERINAEVARMVYELRQDAGLTQKELAELIGTTQSVISGLEDADYEGHSLSIPVIRRSPWNRHKEKAISCIIRQF